MPGFNAVKLSMAGMYFPAEEAINVKGGSTTYVTLDNFPMKTSTEDINILYGDSLNFTGIGKEAGHLLVTSTGSTLTYDKDTDDYFVASYNDGADAESYLLRATSFGLVSGSTTDNQTTIQYKKDGAWTDLKSDAKNNDVISIGNVELTLSGIDRTPVNDVTFTAAGGSNVVFNRLYSVEGMQVTLPYTNAGGTAGDGGLIYNSTTDATTFDLIFSEEDRNGNIASGNNITATLGWNSAATHEAYVSAVSGNSPTFAEMGDTDHFVSYVYSALATALDWDKSGDQYELTLTYHGDEAYGEIYLTAPNVVITPGEGGSTPGGSIGEILVKDSEVSSVSSKT
jgi:hypothetical protein